AMQQPAQVRRQLLRLRPWQQHAEVQRMQETLLVDPLLFLDDNAMHHGDLARGAAEAEGGDAEPDVEGFAEGGSGSGRAHQGVTSVVGWGGAVSVAFAVCFASAQVRSGVLPSAPCCVIC